MKSNCKIYFFVFAEFIRIMSVTRHIGTMNINITENPALSVEFTLLAGLIPFRSPSATPHKNEIAVKTERINDRSILVV